MSKKDDALKLALVAQRVLEAWDHPHGMPALCQEMNTLRKALAEQPAQQEEPVTILPDGSAFAVVSYPLPKDHWLYADRQYNDGEYEPVELGKPVLTHELRDAVVSAVRYAIRGATNCGKEVDFDPDALVKNAVYALCGPFTSPQPAQRKPLTDDPLQGAVDWLLEADGEYFCTATVQRTLRIGYNRAKRLCDTAKERAAHGITKGNT